MIRNILSVLIFFFSISFFYLVVNFYYSDKQDIKVKKNRETILQKIKDNMIELPILDNDTNNVIEFNSGFENENNKKKRSFWELFKKNE